MKRLSTVNKVAGLSYQDQYDGLHKRLMLMAQRLPKAIKKLQVGSLTQADLKDITFTSKSLGISLRDMALDAEEITEIIEEVIKHNSTSTIAGKSPEAQRVLQLMDGLEGEEFEDYGAALRKVLEESGVDRKKLEKELDRYI